MTSKDTVDSTQDIAENSADIAHRAVAKTAAKVDELVTSTQRAAAQVEDMARAGIERARVAGASVAQKAGEAGERTTQYVRDEPVKALLIAAAAGAAATLLLTWATRRHSHDSH